ncbi:uncharacterized protein DUF4343 [Chitinophaga dinghuensis]|uniref:Uncharacterized protein DUF4343 n=1 Tax=Chitinophaga dinghuensis TaxID=1539050 RepID=A0A327WB59_9BACT|nr:ATP-grasp domain-containing protein [Chitinophaga dinghuensis]RAJ87429.1 uncharacterized protein DUF4343 [Chitinophaga dinghuensis]
MNNPITLLIPEKTDVEFDQVVTAWTNKGGQIRRLGKYWIKDESLNQQPIAIYGNQTFSLVLAQIYNVALVSPDDTLIAALDKSWTKRDIKLKTIEQVLDTDFPVFIKPVIPKLFLAGIFQTRTDFQQVINGLQQEEQLILSSIIAPIQAEARCFVMDGIIRDVALYEGDADLKEARHFLSSFIDKFKDQLPNVVVVDVAYNEGLGWFVLEFNACWGAGLNNCDAESVIDCIIRATEPVL